MTGDIAMLVMISEEQSNIERVWKGRVHGRLQTLQRLSEQKNKMVSQEKPNRINRHNVKDV